jgi:hypothetical protein
MMSRDQREPIARRAYTDLGPSPSQHALLQVACGRSHHLAAVYRTDRGMVYHTILHSKSHGDRDLYDSGHHGTRLGTDWYDLLDAGDGPSVDDGLPAGCECGPYSLSRSGLLESIAQGEKKVIVD